MYVLPGNSITGSMLPGLPTLLTGRLTGLPMTIGGLVDPGLRIPLPAAQYPPVGGDEGGGLGSSGMVCPRTGLPCPKTGL